MPAIKYAFIGQYEFAPSTKYVALSRTIVPSVNGPKCVFGWRAALLILSKNALFDFARQSG